MQIDPNLAFHVRPRGRIGLCANAHARAPIRQRHERLALIPDKDFQIPYMVGPEKRLFSCHHNGGLGNVTNRRE